MVEGLLLCIATGLVWTGIAAVCSYVARKGLDIVDFQLVFGAVMVIGAWGYCDWPAIVNGPVPKAGLLAANMITAGIIGGIGMLAIIWAMRIGHQSITWTLSQSSMVVPFLAGLAIWSDPARPVGSVGVGAVLASLVLLGVSRRGENNHGGNGRLAFWLVLVGVTFVCWGVQQTLCTLPSRWEGWADVGRARLALHRTGAVALMAAITLLRRRLPGRESIRPSLVAGGLGIIGGISLFAAMDAMAQADRVGLVFPLCISTCVAGFALYSRLWLKEKLGLAGATGLVLSVAGILLIGLDSYEIL